MRSILFLFLFFQTCVAGAQQAGDNSFTPKPRTYAVVIGISQYENNGIGSLDFADRDARVFADFLRSKAGGSVPEENIRLLLNEKATFTAMYTAIEWLLEIVGKDDIVFFYFSGHGDKESVTIRNLGYLLSYNTPRTNYINNALRIEDLNDYANVLSVKNNAKVILITDACHSGKLVGNENRGTFLVGEQLRKVLSNEIRMTSSGPDQLSNEDPGWGGGRGVFSYYLINGLQGQAEQNNDGKITVGEIKSYLQASLAADPLLAQKEHQQQPVINGADSFQLAAVDKLLVSSGIQVQPVVTTAGRENEELLPPIPKPPVAYFFEAFESINAEELVDYKKLNELAQEEIPFAFMDAVLANSRVKLDLVQFDELKRSLARSEYTLKRFISKLVVLLVDRAQSVINLYLEGDEAELERRRYYNSKNNGYDVFPEMLALALKLISPQDRLYAKVQIKYHYFSGIVARLKIPLVEDYKPLLEKALEEQYKAYALEENAAYINNELGVLHQYKKEDKKAEDYYKRAAQIAPQWVIPQSNLLGIYATTGRFELGAEQYQKAKELQPRFQGIYLNGGVLYEKQQKLLTAEELFRRSIDINSRHYLPFERLGYVYMHTTQYAAADSFFYEADLRKKGYHFTDVEVLSPVIAASLDLKRVPPCEIDTAKLAKNDVLGHFVYAAQAYERRDFETAERFFKKTISIDRANPLVYHYLGKLLYEQERWQEGDVIFNLAIQYYLYEGELATYYNKKATSVSRSLSRTCIIDGFRLRHYKQEEDLYFLGTLYENWHHYSEAETVFRNIISSKPSFIGGYYKLWNLLEQLERNKDAELVIRSYAQYDKKTSDEELIEFYRRMTHKYPADPDWYYKAGIFLYHLAKADPGAYEAEMKKIKPDTDGKELITAGYTGGERSMDENISLPGTLEVFMHSDLITQPRTEGISLLLKADSLLQPGNMLLADINYKLGDLYVWLGLPVKASPHYQKSVNLQPFNSGARLKLIDTYASTWYYQDAWIHLDTLYNRKEINYPKLLMLATFNMYDGNFTKAEGMLGEAAKIYPFKMPAIDDLYGRLNLLAKKPQQALSYYREFLTAEPQNFETMYSIAKLNAITGNETEAWKWLEKALDNGFNYSWVLKFDTAWDPYRTKSKWKAFESRYPMKAYPPPANSQLF